MCVCVCVCVCVRVRACVRVTMAMLYTFCVKVWIGDGAAKNPIAKLLHATTRA